MRLRFVKLQGTGNDFLVVDRRGEGTPVERERAIALCDRRFGVGGDGVLSVLPSERAPVRMHVTNADGSTAEMCGNGLRCVVRWAVDEGVLPASGGRVETGRGVLDCRASGERVTVDMGAPILLPRDVPFEFDGERAVDVPLDLGRETRRITAVSMGNPHAVHFVEGEVELEALARSIGPAIENHPRFPRRANAGFARFTAADAMDLVVWERGAGLTLACGTGACSAAVAAALTNRARAGTCLKIRLPGGVLEVSVEPDFTRVFMTGPAVRVFDGVVE